MTFKSNRKDKNTHLFLSLTVKKNKKRLSCLLRFFHLQQDYPLSLFKYSKQHSPFLYIK